MPYIKQAQRKEVDNAIEILGEAIYGCLKSQQAKVDGVLNYVITRLIDGQYGTSYTELNAAIGMLECAKLELYRRRIAPYEDIKREENGDVYDGGGAT